MIGTMQELRFALRTLRKSFSFTATSVATLALAIGASTVMFSVLNAVLFRPLPYRSPEQLAMLWTEIPGQSLREGRSAYLNVEEWRLAQNPSGLATLLVRTSMDDPLRMVGTVQAAVRRVEKYAPIYGVTTLPAISRLDVR